jgi:hypothetical protein
VLGSGCGTFATRGHYSQWAGFSTLWLDGSRNISITLIEGNGVTPVNAIDSPLRYGCIISSVKRISSIAEKKSPTARGPRLLDLIADAILVSGHFENTWVIRD